MNLGAFDLQILEIIAGHRELWITLVFLAVSEFGQWFVICGLALCFSLWLLLKEKFVYAQGVALAVATSGIAVFLLKSIIARQRPPSELWAYKELWYSFPSAHATMSLAFYGLLVFILARSRASKKMRSLGITILTVLILLIGISRMYLGVHYPSDILAGYLLGAACLLLSMWTITTLERKGAI